MKTTTLLTHGFWATLLVGAFLLGRGGNVAAVDDPDRVEERGMRSSASQPTRLSWTHGPGDSPSAFEIEMNAVLSDPDEERRTERAIAMMSELTPLVLDGLTDEMVPGILELFKAAGDYNSTWHKEEPFFRAWARVNPAAAFAYVTTAPKELVSNVAGQSAVTLEWIKSDPRAAQDAVLAVNDQGIRYYTGFMAVSALANTDLDAAIEFSARYENATQDGKYPAVGSLAKKILEKRGVASVQAWLDAVDVGKATTSYKSEAIEHLAYWHTGPDMAAILAAPGNRSFVTSELLRDIAGSAVSKESDRLGKGLDWLANLPPEVGPQRQAIGERFEKYLKQDFEAAGQWLAGQQLGPEHDAALEVFARDATMDDLPTAMLWAKQISDPALRAATIRFIQERGGWCPER